MSSTYTITTSEQQARIMRHALEFFARAHIGQLHLSEIHPDLGYDDEKEIENLFKSKIGLSSGSSHSISSDKIHDNSREAWDMVEVLRHQFWKEVDKNNTATVDAYPSHNFSGKELIKIKKDGDCNE